MVDNCRVAAQICWVGICDVPVRAHRPLEEVGAERYPDLADRLVPRDEPFGP